MELPLFLAITPGSEDGVGPELMVRAICSFNPKDNLRFIWCGDESSLRLASERAQLAMKFSGLTALIDEQTKISFLRNDNEGLPRPVWFLHNAVTLAKKN